VISLALGLLISTTTVTTLEWQALAPEVDDGTAVWALLFSGHASLEDWDLEALLLDASGDEAGRQRMEQLESCLNGRQQVRVFRGAVVA
jgi:hypothetical protein